MSFTHIDYTIAPDAARAYIAKRKDDAARLALDLISGTVHYVKVAATPQGVTLDFPGRSVQCTNAECAIAFILQRWW